MDRYVLGVTGASGAVYGLRAMELLLNAEAEVHMVITEAARKTISQEMGLALPTEPAGQTEALLRFWIDRAPRRAVPERVRRGFSCYAPDDLGAPPSTGAFATSGMIIAPCTMAAAAAVAAGLAGDLIERTAEVTIKEGRPLVVVPREAPLSGIHLRNLLALSEMGVRVHPACPSFAGGPKDVGRLVDSVVVRALASLGVEPEPAEDRFASPRPAKRY
ncbi:MAG TPA: UbiX family flavin prenyltransferase [Bacillota bacterium]|jgi:4-hydroxy-3-polyprenylbenzoate decarboxylase